MCYVEKSSAGAFIKTGFWHAPRRQTQSLSEKFLSLYFLICPERNHIGMFPIHFGEVVGRTFGDSATLVSTLNQLVAQGEIVMEGYWVMVPSWWDHNHQPGPGHRDRVERALSSAPVALRAQWESVAVAAGVYPFSWSQSESVDPNDGTGGTPGPTSGRILGNNNPKGKQNSKNKKGTTTTTSMGKNVLGNANSGPSVAPDDTAYERVTFAEPDAEKHRPAFTRVCISEGLSPVEAQQLADELSARVEQARLSADFRVQHHEPWLHAVVRKAREAGAPIVRVGAKYQQAEEMRLKQAKEQADRSAERRASEQRQHELRTDLARTLEALTDLQLAELAGETECLFPEGTARAPRIRARSAILARAVPSGLGQVLLARALKTRTGQ